MNAKAVVLTMALCFTGVGVSLAQEPHIGTWMLNEARSKLSRRTPKETKLVYEAVGDAVKVTIEGVASNGKPTRNEWMGKFNGKDYPVTGDPTSDMRSYTRIDDRTLGLNVRKRGEDTVSGRIQVSPDGKTCTVTVRGIDSSGRKFHSVAVYDRK